MRGHPWGVQGRLPDTPEVRDRVALRVAAGELLSHEYVFTDVCPVYPLAGIRKGQGG